MEPKFSELLDNYLHWKAKMEDPYGEYSIGVHFDLARDALNDAFSALRTKGDV